MPLTSAEYHSVGKLVARYWAIYGGWNAVWRSPYFQVSIALAALTCGFWSRGEWWTQVVDVLPNLLGFTLGGFAVFLGFGDAKFLALISGKDEEEGNQESPYMSFSATFLHFVLLQVVALLWAILNAAMHSFSFAWLAPISPLIGALSVLAGAVGYWLFLYSILAAAAAAFAVFRVAGIFDQFSTAQRVRGDAEQTSGVSGKP